MKEKGLRRQYCLEQFLVLRGTCIFTIRATSCTRTGSASPASCSLPKRVRVASRNILLQIVTCGAITQSYPKSPWSVIDMDQPPLIVFALSLTKIQSYMDRESRAASTSSFSKTQEKSWNGSLAPETVGTAGTPLSSPVRFCELWIISTASTP